MNVLIDLLGALMIATMLLLMMITFQMQLRNTADRTIFAAQMMLHESRACVELNHLIALAGINMPASTTYVDSLTVKTASDSVFHFRTYWDFVSDQMTPNLKTVTLALKPLKQDSEVGRELDITQGTPVQELASILYFEKLKFTYFDINGNKVLAPMTTAKLNTIMSVNMGMTFKRNPPNVDTAPLRTRVELKIFLMNRYLRKSS